MASFAAQKGLLGCGLVAPKPVQTRRSAIAARAGPYDEELIKTAVSTFSCQAKCASCKIRVGVY